jgi:hypothetical protein
MLRRRVRRPRGRCLVLLLRPFSSCRGLRSLRDGVHRGLSKGESWLVSTLRAWVRKSTEHLLEWSLTASGWFFKSSRFFSSSAISCWKPPMRPANGISETAFRRGGRLISWFEWLHIVAQRKGHCKHGLKYWIHGIALCWVVVIHARTPCRRDAV